MRSGIAAATAASVLYYAVIARPEHVRIGAARAVLVAAVAAILVGLYGVLLAAPSKARLWSWIATAMALLALAGFAAGQAAGP